MQNAADPQAPAETVATQTTSAARTDERSSEPAGRTVPAREIGGPTGPEPTRFGDWEKKGRCIDF